jgi:hypothetical protein
MVVSNVEIILRALELIMCQNYFKFGNTYWLQLIGTAMGTPPAPMYVTLYFGIREMEVLPLFSTHAFPSIVLIILTIVLDFGTVMRTLTQIYSIGMLFKLP